MAASQTHPKHIWGAAGVLVACIGIAATLHAQYVIPAVVAHARKQTMEEIDRHMHVLHPGSVSRSEFNMILSTLARIEDKVDSR